VTIALVSVIAAVAIFIVTTNLLFLSLPPSIPGDPSTLYNPESATSQVPTETEVPSDATQGNGASIATDDPPTPSPTIDEPVEPEAPSEPPQIIEPPDTVVTTALSEIDELKMYALKKVNDDRADFGLAPVELSDNQAAQVHAEDVFMTQTISHWMTNGEKPYMTYSRYGGLGDVAQNVSVQGYYQDDIVACKAGLALCTPIDPRENIDIAEYGMMYDDAHSNWGHRDNILDRNHTHVSFGIAYDDYYFAFVQNFENQYVEWIQPVTYDQDSRSVSMSGTLAEGVALAGINISYDPSPTPTTYEEHKNDEAYGLGELVAVVVEPPPPGAYYEDTEDHVLVIADKWQIVNQGFALGFSTAEIYERYGDGVYTIVLWVNNGEDIPTTSIAVFIDE